MLVNGQGEPRRCLQKLEGQRLAPHEIDLSGQPGPLFFEIHLGLGCGERRGGAQSSDGRHRGPRPSAHHDRPDGQQHAELLPGHGKSSDGALLRDAPPTDDAR